MTIPPLMRAAAHFYKNMRGTGTVPPPTVWGQFRFPTHTVGGGTVPVPHPVVFSQLYYCAY